MRVARVRILAVATTVVLAACGGVSTTERSAESPAPTEAAPSTAPSQPAASPAPSDDATPPSDRATLDAPPDLVVSSDAGTSHRRPYTYCWTAKDVGVCVDGLPTVDDRMDVRGTVRLSLPLDDWTLAATRWVSLDDQQGPPVGLRPTGASDWVVAERLPAGRHVLEIAGRGPEGDAFWAVPITVLDGPSPTPDALPS